MFAVMKDTDYAGKPTFIDNFFTDWRKILGKNHIIKKFELCDFTPIYEWHLREKEKKKQMTTEASVCVCVCVCSVETKLQVWLTLQNVFSL
jgi:hypothetical protein